MQKAEGFPVNSMRLMFLPKCASVCLSVPNCAYLSRHDLAGEVCGGARPGLGHHPASLPSGPAHSTSGGGRGEEQELGR